jgi:hypothetical protein
MMFMFYDFFFLFYMVFVAFLYIFSVFFFFFLKYQGGLNMWFCEDRRRESCIEGLRDYVESDWGFCVGNAGS